MGELILIEGVSVAPIIHEGQRVVTFAQIDRLHERPKGTASRNFRTNRKYFVEGEDYWEVCADDIRRRKLIPGLSTKARKVILLSATGYLLVATSMTDPRSWAVRRALIKHYFMTSDEIHRMSTDVDLVGSAIEVVSDPVLAFQALQRMADELGITHARLIEVAPDVAFARKVQGSKGSMTISEAAKACGMKPLKFFAWLRDHHFLMKSNMPYQRHIDRGLFEARISVSNGDGTPFVYTQPLITGKGLARVQQVMGCGQSLALELDANPSIPALPGGVL